MTTSYVIFFIISLCARAEIFELSLDKQNRRVIDLGSFGFKGSHYKGKSLSNFTLILKNFKVSKDGDDDVHQTTAPIGFALEQRETANTGRLEENIDEINKTCFVTNLGKASVDSRIVLLFPFSDTVAYRFNSSYSDKIDFPFPRVYDWSDKKLLPGFLTLFFFNCDTAYSVAFSVEVHEYNLDTAGNKNYLSIGKTNVPVLYSVICAVYFALLVVWAAYLYGHRQTAYKIHYLMLVLLFFKSLSLLLEAVQQHQLKAYGRHRLASDVPYYLVLTVKGCILFAVILLLGTGWSFVKPYLSDRDKRILTIILPSQLIINFADYIISTMDEGYSQWATWRDVMRGVDIVCCFAILLPVVWSIKHLREAGPADGKIRQNLLHLRTFRTFYIALIIYVYFSRIVVVLIQSALHYKVTWVGILINELGTLTFYVFVGHLFKPISNTEYAMLRESKNEVELDLDAVRRELDDHDAIIQLP